MQSAPSISIERAGRPRFFCLPRLRRRASTTGVKTRPFLFSELAFDVMKNARDISHLFSSFSFIPGAGAQSRPRCRGYWTVTCSTTLNSVQPRRCFTARAATCCGEAAAPGASLTPLPTRGAPAATLPSSGGRERSDHRQICADGRSASPARQDFCKACLWQVTDASIDLRDPNPN